MRLARELGMTAREVESRMSSAELTEWIALDRTEPFPVELHIALIDAVAAVASAYSKRPLDAATFLPKLRQPEDVQSSAANNAVMAAIQARMKLARNSS